MRFTTTVSLGLALAACSNTSSDRVPASTPPPGQTPVGYFMAEIDSSGQMRILGESDASQLGSEAKALWQEMTVHQNGIRGRGRRETVEVSTVPGTAGFGAPRCDPNELCGMVEIGSRLTRPVRNLTAHIERTVPPTGVSPDDGNYPTSFMGLDNSRGLFVYEETVPAWTSGLANFTTPKLWSFRRLSGGNIYVFGTVYGDLVDGTDVCGDGSITGGEQCDPFFDGNTCSTGQECVNCACVATVCGDGRVSGNEQCDPQADVNSCATGTACNANCACVTVCGDGIVGPGEACDASAPTNTCEVGACNALCQCVAVEPVCGNGVTELGEACDDGNRVNGDACDNNCTFPGCGNSEIDPGEACDDGNTVSGDGCEGNCSSTTFVCGNGNLEAGEECDDGNNVARDGCSPLCQVELCGNESIDPGEECDDGNRIDGDGCSSACLNERQTGDVVFAGFGGMRGIGTGTLTVSGVSGTVRKALLYWQGPTNLADPSANANVTFNGSAVVGANIGFSSDNCWGFTNSQAYRADVTGLVTGNGSYALSDFLKPGADINGVSLVVFFDDGNAANDQQIFLFDGNDSNQGSIYESDAQWDRTYPSINYFGGGASLVMHVADGQSFGDGPMSINGTEFAAAGGNWQGDTVPNGASAANTSGGLWDIRTFDLQPFLVSGPNNLNLVSPSGGDCLSLIVSVVSVPQAAQ